MSERMYVIKRYHIANQEGCGYMYFHCKCHSDMFEDTKVLIGIRKSRKVRQNNGQKEKDKR
jgi:hypothetical protein